MNKIMMAVVVAVVVFGTLPVRADYYVAQNGQTPASPYMSWATAASNIQDAVNEVALYSSETIWIGSGRYTLPTNAVHAYDATNIVYALSRKINFRGSSGDPADTVIDGEGKYRGFAGDYPHTTPQAFTFDALTISNCVTTNYNGGSAIFFNTGSRTSTSVVQNCVITDCSALRGGGIHWQRTGGNPTHGLIISNSVFRNNQSSGYASAVWTYYNFNLRLIDSVFDNNQAERNTVNTRYANTVIDRCVFTGNVNDHGVIGLGECRATIRNSLFSGNTATEDGVLYASNPGLLDVQNCTIVSNVAGSSSYGAIYLYTSGGGLTCTVVNCVMYSNTVWNVKVRADNPFYATLYVTNSCSSHTNKISNFYANGNITNNPQFANIDADNFRLGPTSPCLNSGLNLDWMTDATDLDGNPRIDVAMGLVDMGCYEHVYRGTMIIIR